MGNERTGAYDYKFDPAHRFAGESGSQPFVQAEELTGRGVRSKREADPCPATAAVD